MTPATPIDRDLSCEKCRYNLRTLAVTARCPECGYPALRSLIRDQAGPPTGVFPSPTFTDVAVRVVARLLGRNVDAVLFVLAAQRYAVGARRRTSVFGGPDLSAAQLCTALRDHALSHYGDRADALATLRFWRLERSEDLGQIVAALIEAGLMYPNSDESPADFRGLFTLDQLFDDRTRETSGQ